MSKIKVGIIGTGFGAKVHAPVMQSHPGFDVVAIASVARGRLDDIKEETGVTNVYGNWQDMLEKEELDLVSVASAPLLHHEMVVKSLEKGSHVLCEKPMSFDSNEAENMIEARNIAGKLGFINFEYRFLPARQVVKQLIDSGKIGRLMHVDFSLNIAGYERYATSKRGWLSQKDQAGGMLGAVGSHLIDSLLWWTNDKVASISGQLSTHVPEFTDENGEIEIRTADDAFQAIGNFVGGGTFSIGSNIVVRHAEGWELAVYGTEGTIKMSQDNKVLMGLGNEPLEEVALEAELPIPEGMNPVAAGYYNAFYRSLNEVHQAISENNINPDLPLFEEGHGVQRVLDAIRQSHEEKRVIEIEQ
ncbi:Gfo/Idh/MocA family protein [Sutcliffiella rhizosphaerae]|uniref:Inositol 2-dehydrogenase/D-chiro-inositol 3-dehydrogenase n=1 Tax=Sutcliffiella rhizosphaerae TaxID=2880967 RepID=A0ABN8AFM5_9BACI|nr:Gfo/Idh/MocA family oxidoreductase [Sutcliffiella rhizosphaerae]CAG9622312.1 Inositol 2-dehydrogenase/D-chiro-inositol 3-dehydrogenase [Sutcliffiella rhizosphaerae]